MNIGIAGIHTGIGKTISSAVLAEALEADYWKPVQAGGLEHSDSIIIQSLLSNKRSQVHPEAYRLRMPVSPHLAARLDSNYIDLDKLKLPSTDNRLIVETAGGLMSPLNERHCNVDMLEHFALPVFLVSANYLGSINHSLLSAELLKQRNIKVLGLIFCGEENTESENYIARYSGLPHCRISSIEPSKENIQAEASKLKNILEKLSR